MTPKILFFTGAPEPNALLWDESIVPINNFEERIARYAGLHWRNSAYQVDDSSTMDRPYWRSLPLERQHLATGISQNLWKEDHQGAQFFATSYIDSVLGDISGTQEDQTSSVQSVEEVLTQFYEQSYDVHQDITSSQIDAVSHTRTSFGTDSSSYNTSESFDSRRSSDQYSQKVPAISQLSDLKDIPNSAYLNAINPQTMTINLIVGIISVPEARNIKTRTGGHVKLIELIAGDETKTGFGINFWLSSTTEEAILGRLRPQDIVLVRNVALSSFRGRVYGQSLRKDVTKVHLLYRKRIDRNDEGGCYSTSDVEGKQKGNLPLEKTKKVRDWVIKFVGAAPRQGNNIGARNRREVLPPDTPPSQS